MAGAFFYTAVAAPDSRSVLLELEGRVMVARAPSDRWEAAATNTILKAGDRVRTMESSRAVILLSDHSTLRLGPDTLIQIPAERSNSALELLRGLLYYFHRDKPGTLPVRTPSAYAVILGTEFAMKAGPDGTQIDVIDGQVAVTNEAGGLSLRSGESATVGMGQSPARITGVNVINLVQWVLYYPAVLDLADLKLSDADTERLKESLSAYQMGDFRAALDQLPPGPANSVDEQLFRAALFLAAGEVSSANAILESISASRPLEARTLQLVRALQTLIAAIHYQPKKAGEETATKVQSPLGDPREPSFNHEMTSALLAESYYQQARHNLELARQLAKEATSAHSTSSGHAHSAGSGLARSTSSGLAWARLAELEFSFGERVAARRALERALELCPRHAPARALDGFVWAAVNRLDKAQAAFDQAISLDGALGSAWLGRGLCRIRQGDAVGGREDLQVAATLEPQRSLFRSYLGKAFANENDTKRAGYELGLAQTLDPFDPTGWLYSSLLNRELNQVNRAIRDLEHASDLNDGRQVYRSRQLLDQDAAVQGANLAGIYADAGLREWSAIEAGRSVQADPANYAGHLFLGDSYQEQRDPGRVNQRFETATITEYLLANLLSPIGAGTLAQTVTQNEYSKLFESDGLGIASSTEYLSRGAWEEAAAQYGTFHNSSYALGGYYRTDPGQRANNDSEQHELSFQFKQQLTAADSVYLRVTQGRLTGGDLRAVENPAGVNRTVRVEEELEPLVLAGYHHEWRPGMHSLALVGWFDATQHLINEEQATLLMNKLPGGTNVSYALPVFLSQRYRAKATGFSAELQQLWTAGAGTAVVGARFQNGELEVRNAAGDAIVPDAPLLNGFSTPTQRVAPDFSRATGYAYYQWQAFSSLLLVSGLTYDWLQYPANFRFGPVDAEEDDIDQWSPKAGVIWTPTTRTTVRGAYSQSLGGVGFEQSLRLEPSQVAGFNQAWRSIIPESVAGANAAAQFESWGLALEQRFAHSTYLSLSGEWLSSEVDRKFGVYDFGLPAPAPPIVSSSARERLDYNEHSLNLAVNQLLGEEWSLGLRYRLSHAELRTHFLSLPDPLTTPGTVPARSDTEAVLHQVNLFGTYQHASGFFGLAEAIWNGQINRGSTAIAGDDFWQFNLQAGWRGWRRRIEIRLGLINLTDQNYRLNPINLTTELPRERTFMAACRLQF
jgi:tetratricopeptide (TPR) repeat protein